MLVTPPLSLVNRVQLLYAGGLYIGALKTSSGLNLYINDLNSSVQNPFECDTSSPHI